MALFNLFWQPSFFSVSLKLTQQAKENNWLKFWNKKKYQSTHNTTRANTLHFLSIASTLFLCSSYFCFFVSHFSCLHVFVSPFLFSFSPYSLLFPFIFLSRSLYLFFSLSSSSVLLSISVSIFSVLVFCLRISISFLPFPLSLFFLFLWNSSTLFRALVVADRSKNESRKNEIENSINWP